MVIPNIINIIMKTIPIMGIMGMDFAIMGAVVHRLSWGIMHPCLRFWGMRIVVIRRWDMVLLR
jgi:hypothetical protein